MEKLKESLEAVVPIIVIVLILSFTIAPVPPGILMAFIIGAILLIVGMMFFTLGAEMSMTPMGERIGTRIAQSKKAAGDHRVVFCTWIYHHNIGTRSAGAGRAGTVGVEYDADPGSCRGSRNLSGGCCTAYVIFQTAVLYAVDLLSGGVYPDIFCIEGLSGDCI